MSAEGKKMTQKKLQRNQVYTICGYAILASILLIFTYKVLDFPHMIGPFKPGIFFETTALFAFGIAWLIKGQTFLKDEDGKASTTVTSDDRV